MAYGDVKMAVTKKGAKYAVVKKTVETYWSDETWYVVDVMSGTIIKKSYSASDAKWYLSALEGGFDTPDMYDEPWNTDYGKPIDMPASLKKMQAQLQNPKPKKAVASKPIGSTSTSISEVIDKGPYKLLKMDDGTYGVLVPSTGGSKLGLKTQSGAAKSANAMLKKMAGEKLGDMGVDAGSDAVDTLLHVYEDRMRDMYGQAAREMAQKQAKALAKFDEKRQAMAANLASGSITQDQYDAWLRSQTIGQQWYEDMVESLSGDLVEADRKAMDMLNGYIPRAYAENMNFATFQIEGDTGISTGFALYNESTVARLVANPEGSLLPELPQAKIDELKDAVWSKQKISSCVTQSILQGESIPAAAKRLETVVGMSTNSAMRAARTSMTAAQNLGRLDAGRRAKSMGIDIKKQWIATVDARTRYSHRELDRETVELEEDFSNGCNCPGHLNSGKDPSEVYNCRCAMRYVLAGHEYDDLPDKTREGQSYEEWKNAGLTDSEKKKEKLQAKLDDLKAQEAQIKSTMPKNKTYSGIWKGDVTLDDYEAKAGAIQAKEDYYLGQILGAPSGAYGDMQVAEAKKHLKDLHDFAESGPKYKQAKDAVGAQLAEIQDKKKDLTKRLVKLGFDDTYSDERKANAIRCASMSESIKSFKPRYQDVWASTTSAQHDGTYAYTAGSGGHNRPLSGFKKPWMESGSGWEERFYVGPNKVDIDYEGKGDAIRRMTELIAKSSYDEDVWLRRGCDDNAIESLLGVQFGSLARMTDDELAGYVGTSNRISGFLSCGAASGTGFTGKPVEMDIYAPAGTQMFYAQPMSAFSSENEMIIQRGASYTVTDMQRDRSILHVTVEVHPEDGYDTFQQDESEWKGPKERYR